MEALETDLERDSTQSEPHLLQHCGAQFVDEVCHIRQDSISQEDWLAGEDDQMNIVHEGRATNGNEGEYKRADDDSGWRQQATVYPVKNHYETSPDSNELKTARTRAQQHTSPGDANQSQVASTEEDPLEDEHIAPLIKQPETRPISQEQLVAEVKGIYAGLVMVESKCIEVDNAASSQNGGKLNYEQWQALIALHRTLLHEHHDFFLASQHPSTNLALRRLASKYALPARMWRHGIHSFLELLRHRLPASLEHILTFIYLAYSMMALLYETVPAFEDTWIECLGDLGRYRMAIEDEDNDIRDREVWTSVSRHWYSKASDKSPPTGRLYHHLAMLARPNALQQLFYYSKSLCVPTPFTSARDSIMTLFDSILNTTAQKSGLPPIDSSFVKTHGILLNGKNPENPAINDFLLDLDNHIGKGTRRWMEAGYYIGITNCFPLLSYGKDDNFVFQTIRPPKTDDAADVSKEEPSEIPEAFKRALYLAPQEVVFQRLADPNILPYFHTVHVFKDQLSLLSDRKSSEFPQPDNEIPRPLPEDFAMKGLLWVDKYYPTDFFRNDKRDDDEEYFRPSTGDDEEYIRPRMQLVIPDLISSPSTKWPAYDHHPPLPQPDWFETAQVYSQKVVRSLQLSLTGRYGRTIKHSLLAYAQAFTALLDSLQSRMRVLNNCLWPGSPLQRMILLTSGVAASPTGFKTEIFPDAGQNSVTPSLEWQWHLAMWLSSLTWIGLAFGFERKRPAGTKNYGIWFSVAAFLSHLAYGYKAFVEHRLDSATSAGLSAIGFTVAWTFCDTRRMDIKRRQLLALGTAIVVLGLDCHLSSTMSPLDPAKSFMALLVPCIAGATFFWWACRIMGACIAPLYN